jgi:O-antigen/teichoic acid export membrane protein
MILPRVLSPEECGKFWVFQNLVELTCIFAGIGLPVAIVQLLGRGISTGNKQLVWELIGKVGRISALASTTSVLIAVCILWWISPVLLELSPEIDWMILFSTAVILFTWNLLIVEAIRGMGELRLASIFAGGQSGGAPGALLFCLMLLLLSRKSNPTAVDALAGYVMSLGLILPGILVAFRYTWISLPCTTEGGNCQFTSSFRNSSGILSLTVPIFITQFCAYITISAEVILAGWYCRPDELAMLGQSRRLMLVMQLPMQMATMATLPSLAKYYASGEKKRIERLVQKSATLCLLAASPIAALFLIAPGSVMAYLFGDFYRLGGLLVVLATVGQLVVIATGGAGYLLMMTGHERSASVVSAACAVLMLVVAPLAGSRWGVYGVAATTSAIWALQSIVFWLLARLKTGIWTHFDLTSIKAFF